MAMVHNGNLLRGEFLITKNQYSNVKHIVAISETVISCTPEAKTGRSEPWTVQLADVIGCQTRVPENKDQEVSFILYHCPLRSKFLQKATRQRRQITFVPTGQDDRSEKVRAVQRWSRMVHRLLQGEATSCPDDLEEDSKKPVTRLLIVINPFGGTGKARILFENKAAPLLREAGFELDVIETERAGHAYDIGKQLPIGKYCGIVVVSGDGLVNELGHGLIHNADPEEALKIPIGILPGGSSCALNCTLLHGAGESFRDNYFFNAAFLIARHRPHPWDVVAVETCTGRRMYSWLSVAWGIIADVDIESERFRRLGAARFQLQLATRVLNLRRYKGKLFYKPVESQEDGTVNTTDSKLNDLMNNKVQNEDQTDPSLTQGCKKSGGPVHDSLQLGQNQNTISETDIGIDINLTDDTQSTPPKELPTRHLVPINEPVPSDWLTVEDEFLYVVAVNQKYLDPDVMVAPESELDDGVIYLQYMRTGPETSRGRVLTTMINAKDGSHLAQNDVINLKVKAFRIQPQTVGTIMTVDGEAVDYGPIQGEVLPSACHVMTGCTHAPKT